MLPPTVPVNQYPWRANQQSRPRVQYYHSMFVFSPQTHALNTPISSKQRFRIPLKCRYSFRETCPGTRKGGPTVLGRNKTTRLPTTKTLMFATGAGITGAVGTSLALQLILQTDLFFLFPITRHGCTVLFFLVTTSMCQDWVILRACCLRQTW